MRHVGFRPEEDGFLSAEQLVFWNNWKQKAKDATGAALSHWNEHRTKPDLPSDLWSQLKQWLLDNFFFQKCAYCEDKFGASSFGDAEHYRPKGQVTIRQNDQEVKVKLADGNDHPGYFWLAYDWKNLVPACQRCNSTGKGTLFPLSEGVAHVFEPGLDVETLDVREDPLLLHPYRHSPEEHLEFLDRGLVKAKPNSARGQKSIETFLLDRNLLEDERKERQDDAKLAFADALVEKVKNDRPISESMARYTGPKARYSEAVKAYIKLKEKDLLTEFLGATVPDSEPSSVPRPDEVTEPGAAD